MIAEDIKNLPIGKLHTIHVVSKTGINKNFNIQRNSPEDSHEFTFYMITSFLGSENHTKYDCHYNGMLSQVTRILDC